jgi:integral membrane sensor domain MASE1/DNA-binding CsgD family transcriptional regulator/GAF domain-containing protein
MEQADQGEGLGPSRLIAEAGPLVLVGAAYVVLALAGLQLASPHPSVTPIWPPTGLAVAAVLLCGQRATPAIFVAAFVVNQLTLPSLPTSAIIASGNTLEAALAGILISYWAGGLRVFATPSNVLKFFAICVVATALGAIIGVSGLTLTGHAAANEVIPIWFTWWMGDLAGAIVVAPCVILWALSRPSGPVEISKSVSTYAAAAAVGLVCLGSLLPETSIRDPISYLIIVPLLWAALKRGTRDTATVALIISVIAALDSAYRLGLSDAVSDAEVNTHIVPLLALIISITIPSLALSAEIESGRATAQIHERHSLEARVLWKASLEARGLSKASNEFASSGTLEELLLNCLEQICSVTNWQIGHVYMPDNPDEPSILYPSSVWYFQSEKFEPLARTTAHIAMRKGQGLPGQVWATGKPRWIPDIAAMNNFPRKKILADYGIRSAFGFPIHMHGKLEAVVEFFSWNKNEPDAHLLRTIMSIGDQLGWILERQHAREQETALQRALDSLTTAIFLIGADGALLYMNDAAKRLIGSDAVLAVDNNGLSARDLRVSKAFEDCLQGVLNEEPHASNQAQKFSLHWGEHENLTATLVPLADSKLADLCGTPSTSAAVFIQEPTKDQHEAVREIAGRYGLSHSEARILEKLSPSESVKSLAIALGLSENTIKTHLQHIFQKTQTRKQSELIELVRSTTPPVKCG